MSLFNKEIEMYSKIVPQIEDLFEENGVDIKIGANCVKTQNNPLAIVLEDLKVSQYENIDRLKGMDLKHVEATLDKLAQFHAATARIYQTHGAFSGHFHKGLFQPETEEMWSKIMDDMWPIIEESILKWGDCEKYLEKIKNVNIRVFELMTAVEAVDQTQFNVLNHGDVWSNNIMFHHNEDGSIRDVKFVDLQVSKWGSPAQDLQYFIISSCNYEIRVEKFDYMIKYYRDQLIRNLMIVQYSGKLPTLLELQVDILKRGFFCVNAAFGVLTAVLLEPNENADAENWLSDSEKGNDLKRQLYTSVRYVNAIKALLPFFENRGLLDL